MRCAQELVNLCYPSHSPPLSHVHSFFGWWSAIVLTAGLNRVQARIETEMAKDEVSARDKKGLLSSLAVVLAHLVILLFLFHSYNCGSIFAFRVPSHADAVTAAALRSTALSAPLAIPASTTAANIASSATAIAKSPVDDSHARLAIQAAAAATTDTTFYHDHMSFWACVC